MDTISSSFESHYLQLHILYHKLSENIMTIMNEVCNTCPYEKKTPQCIILKRFWERPPLIL